MAFVGGVGFFYGPVIGAVLITVLQIAVAGLTKAWLFYFGVFFLVMVLYAPGGLASLLVMHKRLWQARMMGWLLPSYLLAAVPGLILFGGTIVMVEMAYALLGGAELGGSEVKVFGFVVDASSGLAWAAAAIVAGLGMLLLKRALREVSYQWNNVHAALTRGMTA
jgi:branched-chain amino acid transport system permease protein